jgi:hypothetical protein
MSKDSTGCCRTVMSRGSMQDTPMVHRYAVEQTRTGGSGDNSEERAWVSFNIHSTPNTILHYITRRYLDR